MHHTVDLLGDKATKESYAIQYSKSPWKQILILASPGILEGKTDLSETQVLLLFIAAKSFELSEISVY